MLRSRTNRLALALQLALVFALACIAAAAATAPQAQASEGHWRHHRVGLADATTAPTYLVYLWPHGSVTYSSGRDGWNCRKGQRLPDGSTLKRNGWFSDVSAYAWNGTAIGAQVDYDDYDAWSVRSYWHGAHGHVTFDGITFYNGSNVPVLVAGWCER